MKKIKEFIKRHAIFLIQLELFAHFFWLSELGFGLFTGYQIGVKFAFIILAVFDILGLIIWFALADTHNQDDQD